MLKDRRELLEHDIRKLHREAANMYLSIAVGGNTMQDKEYQTLKDKISSLEFDLNVVNRLIDQGQQ